MKHISIIGCGTGRRQLTMEASEALAKAEVLIGSPRLLEDYKDSGCMLYPKYTPREVKSVIENSECTQFAVLVSGDTGFYSAAEKLEEAFSEEDIVFCPGVSTVSTFFAKIRKPWQDAYLLSLHGRKQNLADVVRRNRLSFVLTSGNVSELKKQLMAAAFQDLTVYVGIDLGRETEQIYSCKVSGLPDEAVSPLCVLLVENTHYERRIRTGIPDEEFVRGSIPMTKSPIRAITMSRLAVSSEDICWDIGAGTGSVSVEMALAAWKGSVYAIDRHPESEGLVRANAAHFHVGNITPVFGSAPDILKELPTPDVVFIGGSGGDICSIIREVIGRNPKVNIVLNAVVLETMADAVFELTRLGFTAEEILVQASHAVEVSGRHMMTANNPVYIIAAKKWEAE